MDFAMLNAMTFMDIQECRKCKSTISKDKNIANRVICQVCINNKNAVDFCWYCCKEWVNLSKTDICGNKGCDPKRDRQMILTTCGTKSIGYISCVPTIRACPNCSSYIYHDGGCKRMKCINTQCNTEFCFSCLKQKDERSWITICGEAYSKCPDGVADLQIIAD